MSTAGQPQKTAAFGAGTRCVLYVMGYRDLHCWAARLHVSGQLGNVAAHGAAGAGAQLRAATHSHGRQRGGGSSQATHALLERAAHRLWPEALERGQRVCQSRLDEPRLSQHVHVVRVHSAAW